MTENKKISPVNVGIIVAIVILLLTLGIYILVSNKYGTNIDEDTSNIDINGNQIDTLKYFTYTIPKDVAYVIDESKHTIVMGSEQNNWYVNVEYVYDPNDEMFNNYDKIGAMLSHNGYEVLEKREVTIGGNDIDLYDLLIKGEQGTVFYQKEAHGFVYEVTLYMEDTNHSERAVINKIINILSNAKFNENMPIDEEPLDLSNTLSEIENN